MTTTIEVSNLSLKEVQRFLKLERQFNPSFNSLLSLGVLTEVERHKLEEICRNFENYYEEGDILAGEIKFLFISPLMWLAGFYCPKIRITLEEGINDIVLEDEESVIKGRIDILAATRVELARKINLIWILLIESKRSRIDASVGLPQLLAYAYSGLEQQESVWGLTTNGLDYQFVYIQKGNPSTYQIFPKLSLMYPEQSIQLLQVMKAIVTSIEG